MFVFGIDLPVAELLSVTLAAVIIALVIIIVQLVRMGRHIRVLDETTLEIRRYEEEEERTLKPLRASINRFSQAAKRFFTRAYAPGWSRLERRAATLLIEGRSPKEVKNLLLKRGLNEPVATRTVNQAVRVVERFASLGLPAARDEARRFLRGARK